MYAVSYFDSINRIPIILRHRKTSVIFTVRIGIRQPGLWEALKSDFSVINKINDSLRYIKPLWERVSDDRIPASPRQRPVIRLRVRTVWGIRTAREGSLLSDPSSQALQERCYTAPHDPSPGRYFSFWTPVTNETWNIIHFQKRQFIQITILYEEKHHEKTEEDPLNPLLFHHMIVVFVLRVPVDFDIVITAPYPFLRYFLKEIR